MEIEVGDRVRTLDGIEGTVVEVTDQHVKFVTDEKQPYWWDMTLAGLLYRKP